MAAEMRLAIVGCGAIAEWHWTARQAAARRTRVTACVDPDAARAAALAAECADAVAILVPHHLREALAGEAFAAGRHVLLEKPPLAGNAQYWPGALRAKQLLDEGTIGALRTAHAWCCTPFMLQFYAANGSAAAAGGGEGEIVGASDSLRSYEGEWGDFEAAVLDGTPLAAPPDYALRELRAALAMYRSAASGRWERVWD